MTHYNLYTRNYNGLTGLMEESDTVNLIKDHMTYHIAANMQSSHNHEIQRGLLINKRDMNYHAHISRESADCDGRYSHYYVEKITDIRGMTDTHSFKSYVIGSNVRIWEAGATLTVDRENCVSIHSQTDEGYEAYYIEFCDDDCSDESVYHDHSAEAAGY